MDKRQATDSEIEESMAETGPGTIDQSGAIDTSQPTSIIQAFRQVRQNSLIEDIQSLRQRLHRLEQQVSKLADGRVQDVLRMDKLDETIGKARKAFQEARKRD